MASARGGAQPVERLVARGAPAARARRLADSAGFTALVALSAATLVALLRLTGAMHGDVSGFIVAGDRAFDDEKAEIHLYEGSGGYDGQFSYRLALDPTDLTGEVGGLDLDSRNGASRAARIAYPALAWAGALGQRPWVPWSMVAVNVAGIGVLGWLGARLAQLSGRRALWGLLLAGYPGYLFTMGRGLTEVVTSAALVAGLLALRRGRAGWAALALSIAVLGRETALAAPVAYAAWQCWLVVRRERAPRPVRTDLAWAVPIVAFAGWQAVCWSVFDVVPVLYSAELHLADPTVGTRPGTTWLRVDGRARVVTKLVQAAVLGGAVLLAGFAVVRRRVQRPYDVLAWAIALVLGLRVLELIWNDWASFRAYGELYALTVNVLLASTLRLRAFAPALAVAWVLTARGLQVWV